MCGAGPLHARPTIGTIARVRLRREQPRAPRPQPRALSQTERAEVLGILHQERFVDQAPATIYATLLDEGRYVCSVPTMYRVLRAADEVHERRRQASASGHGQARAGGHRSEPASGRGISPSYWALRNGPTTTST